MKFQLITFENTIENAREILANLGQNIVEALQGTTSGLVIQQNE